MLVGTPQTISIALGAVLITLIDYRIEIVIMGIGSLASAVYLTTRETEEEEETQHEHALAA